MENGQVSAVTICVMLLGAGRGFGEYGAWGAVEEEHFGAHGFRQCGPQEE